MMLFENVTNIPLNNTKPLSGVYVLQNDSNGTRTVLRQGIFLYGLKFDANSNVWKQEWAHKIFNLDREYPLDLYPWTITDNLLPDKAKTIVIKHPDGVQFYSISHETGITLLSNDNTFHDVNERVYHFGHFYPDESTFGIMSTNEAGEAKFYGVNRDSLKAGMDGNGQVPSLELHSNKVLLNVAKNSEVLIMNFNNANQSTIALFNTNGLELYNFNSDYLPQNLMESKEIMKSSTTDKIYFANLTQQKFKDVLHLNATGLNLYQYQSDINQYTFLKKNINFIQDIDWNPNYSDSIYFFDINSDGRDELMYTGPLGLQVLSYDVEQNDWTTLITFDTGLTAAMKYSSVVAAIPNIENGLSNPLLLLQDSNGKLMSTFVKISDQLLPPTPTEEPVTERPEVTEPPFIEGATPAEVDRKYQKNIPHLRWSEQWDQEFISKPVDLTTGFAKFIVPLVDAFTSTGWKLSAALQYSSESIQSKLLGLGWRFSTELDYVAVDYQGSVFQEDAKYHLMIEGQLNELEQISVNDTVRKFKLKDTEDEEDTEEKVSIEYDSSKELWTIDGAFEQVKYGVVNGAGHLQLGLAWEHWRGPGRNPANMKQIIHAWYVSERLDKTRNHTLRYTYEHDSETLQNKDYTSSVRLKSINDVDEISINLSYQKRATGEFDTRNPLDKKDNVLFPIAMEDNSYLTDYEIKTVAYQQHFQFMYEMDGNDRILKSIHQIFPSLDQSILEFQYEKVLGKSVLKEVTLVEQKLKVEFNHESIVPAQAKILRPISLFTETQDPPTISEAKDYTIVSYANHDQVLIKIVNIGMSLITELSTIRQGHEVLAHQVHAKENSFVIILRTTDDYSIHAFKRVEDKWNADASSVYFEKDCVVQYNYQKETLFVMSPGSSDLKIYKPDENTNEWNQEIIQMPIAGPITRFTFTDHLVVVYNNQRIALAYKDTEKNWQTKTIDLDVSNASYNNFLSHFVVSDETKSLVLESLNQSGLQAYKNMIVLNSVLVENGQLISAVLILTLNQDHTVAKHKWYKKERKHILDLRISQTTSETEIKEVQFGYRQDGDKYKIDVFGFTGTEYDKIQEIKSEKEKRDQISDILNKLRESLKDSLEDIFAVDLNPFRVSLRSSSIQIGNDTILNFNNEEWIAEELPLEDTIHLGEYFSLKTFTNDPLKIQLLKGSQIIEDIKLSPAGRIVNNYPAYIAYQNEQNSTKILTFNDKEINAPIIFDYETLLLESDLKNLYSWVAKKGELHKRPMSTLLTLLPQSFVKYLSFSEEQGMLRQNAYERNYVVVSETGDYSQNIIFIPGANKSTYGSYKLEQKYNLLSGESINKEIWLNDKDEEVKTNVISEKENETQRNEFVNNPSILMDKLDRFIVSDFRPYQIDDDMVSYYGFEDYERNQIGPQAAERTWVVNDGQIISGKFAFTGINYLSLNGNSSNLEGEFTPKDQQNTYLTACWVRGIKINSTADPAAPYLKAIITTPDGHELIKLLGSVQHHKRDWSYLELPIDMEKMHEIYKQYLQFSQKNQTNTEDDSTVKLKIVVQIKTNGLEKLDVDHIRFSPITHNFEATVFDQKINKPTATLHSNGLVSKIYYDKLHRELAVIQKAGYFEKLSTGHQMGESCIKNSTVIKSSQVTFEPSNGFYETFEPYSFLLHWEVDDVNQWKIGPGQLWHVETTSNKLKAKSGVFNENSSAIRFEFGFETEKSELKMTFKSNVVEIKNGLLQVNGNKTIEFIFTSGELIFLFEEDYLFLWLNGALIFEEKASKTSKDSEFILEVTNEVLFQNVFVMNHPVVSVAYVNSLNEVTQVIKLRDPDNVIILETLYDDLGRDAITTKGTLISREINTSLLSYRPNFVKNRYPTDSDSVWYKGKVVGEVSDLNQIDEGYPYKRTVYASDPLNTEVKIGLAGAQFSIDGPFAVQLKEDNDIAFIHNLFPIDNDFKYKTKIQPNGSKKVTVFNKNGLEVAMYVRVDGTNHILSTNEYDAFDNLVKILPPLYHEMVGTAFKTSPYQAGDEHLTSEEKYWQNSLATRFIYNQNGQLISKSSSDQGTQHFIYTKLGTKRFDVQMNSEDKIETVTYYKYDADGEVIETGFVTAELTLDDLRESVDDENLPEHKVFQVFNKFNNEYNPLLRGRIRDLVTYNMDDDSNPVFENLQYNERENVEAKRIVFTASEDQPMNAMKKTYENNKVLSLRYPTLSNGTKPVQVQYSYNKLGQLIGLGSHSNPFLYGKFSYQADGALASEMYEKYNRTYSYNSPDFLTEIADPFLKEALTYVDHGYGQAGFGDGVVMSSIFNATWYEDVDGRQFQIKETDLDNHFATKCLRALKLLGYIGENQTPEKLLTLTAEDRLPLVCRGSFGTSLAKVVATKLRPTIYGHRYAYGTHQELIKAKYFEENTEQLIDPLHPNAFLKNIPDISSEDSENIWNILTQNDYIYKNQLRYDPNTAQGTAGKETYQRTNLLEAIKNLNERWVYYTNYIGDLLLKTFSQKIQLTLNDFQETFLWWDAATEADVLTKNVVKQKAEKIYKSLQEIGYISDDGKPKEAFLTDEFIKILSNYKHILPEITQTMLRYFSHLLGQSAFDVESFQIDANGNHKLYYTGFDRYQLNYHNGTNQINEIQFGNKQIVVTETSVQENPPPKYSVKHDSAGNIIQAMHKNIAKISYHPISQRATSMLLADGREIFFYYDAKGERIMKHVFSADKKLDSERYYVRDEAGKVLTERYTRFQTMNKEVTITNYIYGPRGLHGFIRNGDFYNVFTDHMGSIRLVIKDGQVIAAYDYMPYGESMRSVQSNPLGRIIFRYTGQEYDEETGLYNYHARFYDPAIGRFFQPDPKAQYFSPYKYAGNSPVSFVDPDGQFAFLIACLVLAIGGAYLAAAAANNSWNPAKWDWGPKTWLALIGGAIGGALLPGGFLASSAMITAAAGAILPAASAAIIGPVATVLLGGGGAFLFMAAGNGFDPTKWDWGSPSTWNTFFTGFSTVVGLPGTISGVHKFAATLKYKKIFLSVTYMSAGMVGVISVAGANDWNFAFWQWDPKTVPAALISGFSTGVTIPQSAIKITKQFSTLVKNTKEIFKSQSLLTKQTLKQVLKSTKHPMKKTVETIIVGYVMGSITLGDFDITKWNLTSYSTYEALYGGVSQGNDLKDLVKQVRKAKPKKIAIHNEYFAIIDHVGEIQRNGELNGMTEKFFKSDTEVLGKIRNENFTPEVTKQIDDFLKAGEQNWKKDPLSMPKELKSLFYKDSLVNAGFLETLEPGKLHERQTKLLDDIFIAEKSGLYEKMVTKFFNSDEVVKMKIESENFSSKINKDIKKFFDAGYDQWNGNKNSIPKDLHKLFFQDTVIEVGLQNVDNPPPPIKMKNLVESFPSEYLGHVEEAVLMQQNKHLNSVVESFFNSDDVIMKNIKNEKFTPEVMKNIDEFHAGGSTKWHEGKTKMPSELETLFKKHISESIDHKSSSLNELKAETKESIQKQNQLILEEKPLYVSCQVSPKVRPSSTLLCTMHPTGIRKQSAKVYTKKSVNFMLQPPKEIISTLESSSHHECKRNLDTVDCQVNQKCAPDSLIPLSLTSEQIDMSNQHTSSACITKIPSFKEHEHSSQTPPPTYLPLAIQPSFTQGHFQGIMALLDVALKKLNKQKHPEHQSNFYQLSWEEACIEATEIIDLLEENIQSAVKYTKIPKELLELDLYELYYELTKKLTSGDLQAAQNMIDQTVDNLTRSLFKGVQEEKIDEFVDQMNANPINVYEHLMRSRPGKDRKCGLKTKFN